MRGVIIRAMTIPIHGPLAGLPLLRRGITSRRASSYDRTGGNNDFVRVEAGASHTLADLDGAGVIRHVWVTLACDDPLIRRNAVLRCWWDGEDNPSVEAPLGDFFGQGWGEKYLWSSLPLAAAPLGGNALNCWFAMPFGQGARIEIENQSDRAITHLYYYVDYEQHQNGMDPDVGRFHAWWNRAMPGPQAGQGDRENEWETLGAQPVNPGDTHNHVLVHAEGQGHYVGVNYFVDSPTPLWYGEGDDMFLIDGEAWPGSLHGTGTEDYFCSSWCPKEIYAHPYFGYARVNNETGFLGRTHCYRFHLEDPVVFDKSLRASIEHGHANSLTLDLCTVAYWYQTEPHAAFAPLPARIQRQPMPPILPTDIHKWRDAWRRKQGGGPLWGNEAMPPDTRIE